MAAALSKIVVGLTVVALAARAETVGFDRDPAGGAPVGWDCGTTDGGAPRWEVEADNTAPSAPNVLVQSGSGSSPWCVIRGTALANGVVEVKFNAVAGSDDQTGGLVWRWKDGNNYYVARASALENYVSLDYVEKGKRRVLKDAKAPVAPDVWHTLRAEFKDTQIRVLLNGKTWIERDDSHIPGPGAVGVWTKSDSVTAFDDFTYQSTP